MLRSKISSTITCLSPTRPMCTFLLVYLCKISSSFLCFMLFNVYTITSVHERALKNRLRSSFLIDVNAHTMNMHSLISSSSHTLKFSLRSMNSTVRPWSTMHGTPCLHLNGRKYECNERSKPKMPVSKCKRSKQNIQTPVSFSVATQTKTTVYLSARMLLYKFMHISVEK